jgi:phosphonate transport system ATP-binding protein
MHLLVNAAREHQMALVVNLHQVDIALEFCDRIVGLRQGKVAIDDLTTNLTADSLQPLYIHP